MLVGGPCLAYILLKEICIASHYDFFPVSNLYLFTCFIISKQFGNVFQLIFGVRSILILLLKFVSFSKSACNNSFSIYNRNNFPAKCNYYLFKIFIIVLFYLWWYAYNVIPCFLFVLISFCMPLLLFILKLSIVRF